jgi:phosphate transport system permease protein
VTVALGVAPGGAPPRSLTHVSARRRIKNLVMTLLMGLALVVVGGLLVLVLITVVGKGIGIVFHDFPAWFTEDISPSTRTQGGGMKAAIVGTLLITAAATVMAVPLGIGGAVYLNEYGRTNPFARLLRFLTNVMTGVPSVVMGLFIYVSWVLLLGKAGISAFSGAMALGCLMLPIVVRSTEEMLKLVPQHLRDASYALGGTRSRTTMKVVLPSAAPGILSGCLLAIARAAGETAPLIFTIGAARHANWHLFTGTNTALSTQIYANARTTFPVAQERAWGAALTLIALSFAFMLLARVTSARLGRTR